MARELRNGLLVAVEGIDGAGKTTQVRILGERLRAKGFDVVASKEPTNGPWGRMLRRSATAGRLAPQDELEAFLEDRREHVRDVIGPTLQRGAIMILDRYYFSTIAYQSLRGMDAETIRASNEVFAPVPDLLAVLDLDPVAAVARIETRERGHGANHFEQVPLLEQSRAVFLHCVATYPTTNAAGRPVFAIVLDATWPPEQIAERLEAHVKRVAVEQIAAAALSPAEALNATLRVMGSPGLT